QGLGRGRRRLHDVHGRADAPSEGDRGAPRGERRGPDLSLHRTGGLRVAAAVTRPPEEAVVLAGGLGTRLRGVVDDRPKPMATIAGRPFLAWLLEATASQGVRRVVLSVGYRRDVIEDYFGRRWQGLDIDYAVEE